MKIINGNRYYEIGDTLYYPYPDTKNKKYIIEKLVVSSTENGITSFSGSRHYNKRVGEIYSPYSNLFLSEEEALAHTRTNPFNF